MAWLTSPPLLLLLFFFFFPENGQRRDYSFLGHKVSGSGEVSSHLLTTPSAGKVS